LKFAKQEAAARIPAEFAPLVKFADPTAAAECPAPASLKVAGQTATIRFVAAGWELALTMAVSARRVSRD
jgi:hypothetical protein